MQYDLVKHVIQGCAHVHVGVSYTSYSTKAEMGWSVKGGRENIMPSTIHLTEHGRLATGNVQRVCSATYQIFFDRC